MIDQLAVHGVPFQLIPLERVVTLAHWRTRAACAGMDPDLFFTEDLALPVPAVVLAACARCPVTAECLEDAARGAEWFEGGVRGGLSQEERRAMPRRLVRELASA